MSDSYKITKRREVKIMMQSSLKGRCIKYNSSEDSESNKITGPYKEGCPNNRDCYALPMTTSLDADGTIYLCMSSVNFTVWGRAGRFTLISSDHATLLNLCGEFRVIDKYPVISASAIVSLNNTNTDILFWINSAGQMYTLSPDWSDDKIDYYRIYKLDNWEYVFVSEASDGRYTVYVTDEGTVKYNLHLNGEGSNSQCACWDNTTNSLLGANKDYPALIGDNSKSDFVKVKIYRINIGKTSESLHLVGLDTNGDLWTTGSSPHLFGKSSTALWTKILENVVDFSVSEHGVFALTTAKKVFLTGNGSVSDVTPHLSYITTLAVSTILTQSGDLYEWDDTHQYFRRILYSDFTKLVGHSFVSENIDYYVIVALRDRLDGQSEIWYYSPYSLNLDRLSDIGQWADVFPAPNGVFGIKSTKDGNYLYAKHYTGTNDWCGFGKLGYYKGASNLHAVMPVSVPCFKAIAGDDNNTIIIKHDGTAWVKGNNEYGRLGLGHNNPVPEWTQVPTEITIGDVLYKVQRYDCVQMIENKTYFGCVTDILDNSILKYGEGIPLSGNIYNVDVDGRLHQIMEERLALIGLGYLYDISISPANLININVMCLSGTANAEYHIAGIDISPYSVLYGRGITFDGTTGTNWRDMSTPLSRISLIDATYFPRVDIVAGADSNVYTWDVVASEWKAYLVSGTPLADVHFIGIGAPFLYIVDYFNNLWMESIESSNPAIGYFQSVEKQNFGLDGFIMKLSGIFKTVNTNDRLLLTSEIEKGILYNMNTPNKSNRTPDDIDLILINKCNEIGD